MSESQASSRLTGSLLCTTEPDLRELRQDRVIARRVEHLALGQRSARCAPLCARFELTYEEKAVSLRDWPMRSHSGQSMMISLRVLFRSSVFSLLRSYSGARTLESAVPMTRCFRSWKPALGASMNTTMAATNKHAINTFKSLLI